ncbi:MAG: carboxymuconolactone decarboxylase family protein [Nannocystaceae bacterium]
MSRLNPSPQLSVFARLVAWFSRRMLGRVPAPFTVIAHNDRVLRGQVAMERHMMSARLVPARLKSLAELRVATLVGCHFCMDIGSMLSQQKGVTIAQVEDLARYRVSPHFSPEERDVLALADAMTRTPAVIPEDVFKRVSGRMTPAAVVELLSSIAWENYRARLNHGLGFGHEGYTDGGVCALPARLEEAA